MSAGRLRDAAALMRERAEAATAGPWETYTNMHAEVFVSEIGRSGFGVISGPATGRDDYGKGNAIHIASWDPAVALAVADWLEATAVRLDYAKRGNHSWHGSREALAVANAYLGGAA